MPILGVVENMNGFVCPKCGEITPILPTTEGRRVAEDMGTPFFGSIPMDPDIAMSSDNGKAFVEVFSKSPTAGIMEQIIAPIRDLVAADAPSSPALRETRAGGNA